jgi:hypothetical protein
VNKYEPRLVSSLLAAEGTDAILEDSTGVARHGYRLVQRRTGSVSDKLDTAIYESYCSICSLIASTLDNILDACSALGYTNLVRDELRVVENATSSRVFRLPQSLPVLLMPYWDNAEQGRHVVPTLDGDACIFHLEDAYAGDADEGRNTSKASFRGVNKAVRYERTLQWLKRPGGNWKNGWYEDSEGGRWFSDVTSSSPGAPYHIPYREFDTRAGREVNCSVQGDCIGEASVFRWGTKFITSMLARDTSSIAVLNASSYGFFLFEANQVNTIRILYDWETLVSNLSVGLVLIRWIISLIVLHAGALQGETSCYGGGIGCVSSFKSFDLLMLSMLPQLKMALTAFWTVGCYFEGQQAGLSEAWFAIYPAIVQLMLMYFSFLNALTKVSRRRVSDALFGPTVVFFCAIHYFRSYLAASILPGVDGRVSTVVFSDEVKTITLLDYFISDLAWRMNGRITVLFWTKLAVLGINLLPLLMARPFPIQRRGQKQHLRGIEGALGLKVSSVGGLGVSPVYLPTSRKEILPCSAKNSVAPVQIPARNEAQNANAVYLNSYELIRLGYVVFGDRYIISIDDWDLLSSMAPLRSLYHFWNQRVCVWELSDVEAADNSNNRRVRVLKSLQPGMWRLDDARLQRIPWWHISSFALQC